MVYRPRFCDIVGEGMKSDRTESTKACSALSQHGAAVIGLFRSLANALVPQVLSINFQCRRRFGLTGQVVHDGARY